MAEAKNTKLGPMGEKALKTLLEIQYCELRPSSIHGIGVFALRNIPEGKDPFLGSLRSREVAVSHEEIDKLPAPLRRLLKTFCYYDEHKFMIPVAGLNHMNLSVYLNHSKQPNLEMLPDGRFRSLRRIDKDEEVTMDYDKSFGEIHRF